tara:strand:- start:244 stop:729 length:486 start_codon:yes stop_codon:yes gene_type:complete
MEDKIACFAYGSNNIEQLKKRVKNNSLISYKAYLPNSTRIFAGYSKKWGGSVASIEYCPKQIVKGSLVFLTNQELVYLDKFEGIKDPDPYNTDFTKNVYSRNNIHVYIILDDQIKLLNAVTYIRNNDSTISDSCPSPSEKYIDAIYENIKQFWDISKEELC